LTAQDEEMLALEDIIADSIEEWEDEDDERSGSHVACEKVASIATLSGRIANDPAFARQLRRKHTQ
jgi:hypothetical protein